MSMAPGIQVKEISFYLSIFHNIFGFHIPLIYNKIKRSLKGVLVTMETGKAHVASSQIFQTIFELGLSLDHTTGGSYYPSENTEVKKLTNGFYSMRSHSADPSILFFGPQVFLDTVIKTEETFNIKLFE